MIEEEKKQERQQEKSQQHEQKQEVYETRDEGQQQTGFWSWMKIFDLFHIFSFKFNNL